MQEHLDGWEVAKFLWGLVMTLLGFLGIRQVNRIDKLEEGRVEQATYDREVDRIRAEHQRMADELKGAMREHRQESHHNFSRVFQRLDEIADRIPKR